MACFCLRAELFMYLVLLKGCTEAANQEARVTEHSTGPGLSIISYTRVCRKNLCNDLATSLPLWSPRPPKGAGGWGRKALPGGGGQWG